MKRTHTSIFFAIIGIVAAIVGALLAHVVLQKPSPPPLAVATLVQPAKPLPEFSLVDQQNQPFDLARLRGHWSLMFFGFTNCGDVCPTTLAMLASAKKSWADLPAALQPQVVFVSVDVNRDTPEVMNTYIRNFDPSFVGVTGVQMQIDTLTRALGVPSQVTKTPNGGYIVDHSAAILALNPQAEFQALFGAPHRMETLISDYRILVGKR